MIRSLRRRHRGLTLTLALTLPALFAAGLAVRRAMPETALSGALAGPAFDPGDVLATQSIDTGSGLALRMTTLAPVAGSAARRLFVELLSDPARPELLVYWRPGANDPGGGLGDAYLLGALSGWATGLFSLPEPAAREQGRLVFFSLAQQEIVDSVELRRPAERGSDR